ncbi:unnamed protein product [Paramecium sonneborni]|uniref:Uncharacterized protein n=1 Tax=Paramecium sonneborni TaxID=65129 RepID=A0A8S1RL40_9CILI|nr:unnamed protein product [Paramecium sonneborni]
MKQVKMLESQNIKLIEQNYNDLVKWKSKNKILMYIYKLQIQSNFIIMNQIESKLTENEELTKQLINKSIQSSDHQSQLYQFTSIQYLQ